MGLKYDFDFSLYPDDVVIYGSGGLRLQHFAVLMTIGTVLSRTKAIEFKRSGRSAAYDTLNPSGRLLVRVV